MYQEKERAARNISRNDIDRKQSSHQNFVENETKESFGS